MRTIFWITIKHASRDHYLLTWSIFIPLVAIISLTYFFDFTPSITILLAITAISILMYGFMTTAFQILSQRRRGVYHVLRLTPMPFVHYIVSTACSWAFIASLAGTIIFLLGMLFFQISISLIALPLIIGLLFLAAVGYVNLGFLISSKAKNEGQMSIMANVITMPLILVSDGFYNLDLAPSWVQQLASYNPFQWLLNGLRAAVEHNYHQYLLIVLFLIGFIVVSSLIAARTFNYRID